MVDSMIILFDSTTTEFTTNGLGTLHDAVSCFVTEERNGEFELEMEYPITGKRYNDLSLRRIIFAKPNPYDDPQPFRIYFISKPMDGIVTINAEHISYDISGYPVSPFTAETVMTAFSKLKESSAIECPFTFFTDKSTAANMTVLKPSSMRSLLGGVEGSILDIYGGEYEFDKYSIKLWNNRGKNRGVSIRYGKNLTDLKQEENCNSVYTGVYPYWYSEQDGLVELSEKIVNAEGVYNFTRIYTLDLSQDFQEIPTEEQLRSRATTYMNFNNIGVPKVSITVEFVPLSQTEDYKNFAILETVYLCDTVNVYFPEMNITATSKCIKTVYDVIAEKYDKIELGNAKSTLASTVSEQNQSIKKVPTKTFMEQAIDHATKLISGGLGGYVIIHSSTGGSHPDEILIMDTDDIAMAVNVWRWNSGGLGYSSTGYNGEFSLAITSDGQIVADFILSGTLNGALLQANSVQSMAISQFFKEEITNEIGTKTGEVEQAFVAADGQLISIINSMNAVLTGDIEIMEENISILRQTVENLTLSYSTRYTGGINLIMNSSGLNGVSDDWQYTGTVVALQDSEALSNTLSGSMFSLRIATLSQELRIIKGSHYTLTFKTCRTSAARGYVKINTGGSDVYIYDEQSSEDWQEYAITFTAASDTLVFTAETTGYYFYIADIMLNEGDSKTHWQPAMNEIYTENVKIDRRGINITNDASATETIIDNTQFAVKHKGSTVLTVNKDLTTLRKTEITDELTVGKLKFVPQSSGIDLVLLD